MTRRTLVQVLAIVRKELREQRRAGWMYFLVTIGFASYIQWFVLRSYQGMSQKLAQQPFHGADPAQLLAQAQTLSLMFVAPMLIPFLGNGFLTRSLIRERLLGTLMPLLATGVDPGVVWAAKVLAAFLTGYVVTLVCVVVDLTMITQYYRMSVTWSPTTLVMVFFVAPLAGLAVLAIMSFLFWVVRAANFIAATLPILVAMSLFGYVSTHMVTQLALRTAMYTTIGAVVVIALCALAINKLSRQFIVGLR